MAIDFVDRGILSLAFVYAFIETLDLTGGPRPPFRSGLALLTCWAVGAVLLALFPTDVPAAPVSWHGAIHVILAIMAFIGGAAGALLLSRRFDMISATRGVRTVALLLSWLSVFLLLVAVFVSPVLGIFGLTEGLFLGSVLLWMLVVSVYMVANKGSISVADSSRTAG